MAIRTWEGTISGDVSVAANYAEGIVPTHGDDLRLENNAVDIDAGLAALGSVRLNTLRIRQSYTGKIGTLAAYLKLREGLQINIGEHYGHGSPAGSQRIKLDLRSDTGSSSYSIVTVHNSCATSSESNLPPIRLLLDDPDTILRVRKGKVGVAIDSPGESSQLDELEITYASNKESDAQVVLGSGVTIATVEKDGGSLTLQCGATAVSNRAGALTVEGTGAIATLTTGGGTVYPNNVPAAGAAIGVLNCDGGLTDFTQSRALRTVTTPKISAGGSIKYDPAVVIMTTPPAPQEPVKLTAAAA